MRYPNYFPKGCPPKDAKNVEIDVYRMCKNSKVSHSDFLSYYELGKAKDLSDLRVYGISLDKDFEKIKAMMGMPFAKHNNFNCIAKGITKKGMGKILATPSNNSRTHITWWLKEGSTPEEHFTCCYRRGN